MDDFDGDSLDAKLAKLRADFGEDIEVYDYGGEDMDRLAGLDEDLNDFNDETFGGGSIGRDFDFSGSTARFLGSTAPPQPAAPAPKPAAPAWTTMPSLLSSTGAGGKGKPLSPWSGGINDDPLLGPMVAPPPKKVTPQPAPAPAAPRPQPKFRTLEEIEAEMRAAAKPSPPPAAPSPAAPAPASKPLTLEEVEAEMLRRGAAAPPQPPAAATPPIRTTESPFRGSPAATGQAPDPASQAQAPQGQQQPQPQLGGPPPLGAVPLPHPQHAELLRLQQQQTQLIIAMQQALALPPLLRPPPPQLQQMNLQIHQLEQAKRTILAQTPPAPPLAGPNAIATLLQQGGPPGANIPGAADGRPQEHDKLEAARRRKGAKIAEMSHYNGLMSQGDKEFITRIQVSQLVTGDYEPFSDDFYYHVYSAIRASRIAAQQAAAEQASQQELVPGQKIMVLGSMEAGASGAKGGKQEKPRLTRREHAMIRMAENVQRIVKQAKERPKMTQLSLDGALGKIALRTRSAPRQLLQVQASADPTKPAEEENHPGAVSSALPTPQQSNERRPAMDRRQVLMALERLYSTVLEIESMRRNQPVLPSNPTEAPADAPTQEMVQQWESDYSALKDKIWRQWRMLEPLDISVPHPFISLLGPGKGKKLLPRTLRLFTQDQSLQILTLLVATFETLDVVQDAPLLDRAVDLRIAPTLPGSRSRAEAERETDLFLNAVVGPMMGVINSTPLDLISGLLALMMDRNNMLNVARSKPGIAFITLFLSRAELLRNLHSTDPTAEGAPTQQAVDSWSRTLANLHDRLSSDFMSLFPSTRAVAALPLGMQHLLNDLVKSDPQSRASIRPGLDYEDEPVWQMFTALAVSSEPSRQEQLLGGIRNKVMDNLTAQRKKLVPDEIGELKLRNVNTLLRGLGLDASMIQTQ